MDITPQQVKEQIQAVQGRLLMVDFKPNAEGWNTCTLYPRVADGQAVPCTFDPDLADTVQEALRHEVAVFGLTTIDKNTGQIVSLHIGELHIIDDDQLTPTELDVVFSKYQAEHDTIADFRAAWKEAMTGDTITWEAFLNEVDADE